MSEAQSPVLARLASLPVAWQFAQNQAYALLRIVVGLLFLCHGSQQLLGFPGEAPAGLPASAVYVAGPIELVGGLLVMLGLFTRTAAFFCCGLMAVAYWMAHGTNALFPIQNGGELAVLYCFLFLAISTRGAGSWSIDEARQS
jgi:putative oxidoreductase